MKGRCENKRRCQIVANRRTFGYDECSNTDEEKMYLWIVYSCDCGTDSSTTRKPRCVKLISTTPRPTTTTRPPGGECNDPGEEHNLRIPGCGGKVSLVCDGGTISILQVTSPPSRFPNPTLNPRFFTVADGKTGQMKSI